MSFPFPPSAPTPTRRLMWANDFPHSDSTWPWSQEMLAEQTGQLTGEQQRAILSGNVADLYAIDTTTLPVHAAAIRSARST